MPSCGDEVLQLMGKSGNAIHHSLCTCVLVKGKIPVPLVLWPVIIMITYPETVSLGMMDGKSAALTYSDGTLIEPFVPKMVRKSSPVEEKTGLSPVAASHDR